VIRTSWGRDRVRGNPRTNKNPLTEFDFYATAFAAVTRQRKHYALASVATVNQV
jgi:hypothetical protein